MTTPATIPSPVTLISEEAARRQALARFPLGPERVRAGLAYAVAQYDAARLLVRDESTRGRLYRYQMDEIYRRAGMEALAAIEAENLGRQNTPEIVP